jgi:hypothetical protein
MDDDTIDLDQIDEESLGYDVSDEVLEAAAAWPKGLTAPPSFISSTSCHSC